MLKPIIIADGVSKKYRLGARQKTYATLRDVFVETVRRPFQRLRNGERSLETIWALERVTFQVSPGEVVGIIGRNGAGKSTLLKVMSRITEPTAGRIELYGRVASLLEVGTGFHPELTGRENIFLNGAILGMRKAETARRFDEIVAFAEIERFIDTPVKHYSSGMYVRLAFAVAAHLEPDILIVDEVLAVGDVAFQKRCLGKMQHVTKQGRTVLLVSHNMTAVKGFCNRALLLDNGRITCEGDVDRVVDTYLAAGRASAMTGIIPAEAHNFGSGEALAKKVELLDSSGDAISQVYFGQPFRVALTIEAATGIDDAVISVGISTPDGTRVTSAYSTDGPQPPLQLSEGICRILVDLNVTLVPRLYTLDVSICHLNGAAIDMVNSTLEFEALGVAQTGNDHYRWGTAHGSVHGFVRMEGRWHRP